MIGEWDAYTEVTRMQFRHDQTAYLANRLDNTDSKGANKRRS